MFTYWPTPRWLVKVLKLSGCVFTLCLGLVVAALGQAPSTQHRLLLDGSGSMKGFFATRQLAELQEILAEAYGGSSDSYYFIDSELVPASQELTRFGDNTYLKNAFDRAIAQKPTPPILWLVTDNQPSSGTETLSDQDIGRFYDSLRTDIVKRLYFFPLRLNFEGKLYRGDNSVLTPSYEGPRGLLVYAMLLDERAREEFERSTSEFQARFQKRGMGDTRRILIKPLEQDTITAKIIPGKKFRVENGGQLIAGDFEEGAQINGKFRIELTSQMGQMKIRKGDIDVQVRDKFHTGDFTESEVKPDFDPHFIENFAPKNVQPIDVEINAPGVHIRNNLISWWNCITHKRGDITGDIQIIVKVQPEKIDVVSALTNEFSTQADIYQSADPAVQSKIFKLDDLVKKMMPERPVSIRPRIGNSADGTIPVRMAVLYPKWPVVALIALVLGLILLLLLLWRLFGRQPLYRLTWDGGRYRQCADFQLYPFMGRSVELNNRAAASIKKTMGGIKVRAAKGYTVDDGNSRTLNTGGTDFNVSQSANGAGVNFYFSSVTAVFSGFSTREESGSILDGIPYGADDGASGSQVGSAPAPPIRKATTEGDGKQNFDEPNGDGGLDLDSL
jgi:hypothetical protein